MKQGIRTYFYYL